jgi:hypothetical protein
MRRITRPFPAWTGGKRAWHGWRLGTQRAVRHATGILALAASLGLAGCGGSQALDAKALQKQAEAIESLAAEAALVAGDVSEGDTTSAFVRVHAEALGKNAQTVVTLLAPGKARPAPGLSQEVDRAHALARSVRVDLAQLEGVPSSNAAATLRDRLEGKAEEAKRLAESL